MKLIVHLATGAREEVHPQQSIGEMLCQPVLTHVHDRHVVFRLLQVNNNWSRADHTFSNTSHLRELQVNS